LTTFLYSVTTFACLNRLRDQRNRARLQRERQLERYPYEEVGQLTPEQRLILSRALETMPDDLAQVAVYRYMDGMTRDEIARVMACSRRTVGNLLLRLDCWVASRETGT
jgi:RNA polymerase sigma factor (sigma-70 family)